MTLYQYKLLDKTDQACVLWSKGVYLAERNDPEHTIGLYQIDGFYVEVFYDAENNAIKRLRSFGNVGQLRPYLDRMDLNGFV